VGKRAGPFPCEVQADLPTVHVFYGGGVSGECAGEETAKRRDAEVAEGCAEIFCFQRYPFNRICWKSTIFICPLSDYLRGLCASAFRLLVGEQASGL